MQVITAPESYERSAGDITCFLAGGISQCHPWQDRVIAAIQKINPSNLILFNPRRENFPIDDPEAAREQIRWEFNALEKVNIFSMYFCQSPSDQPICMYELGRHMNRLTNMYSPNEIVDHLVITVEDGYKRAADVLIQTELALRIDPYTFTPVRVYAATPENHAKDILMSYTSLLYRGSKDYDERVRELNAAMRQI